MNRMMLGSIAAVFLAFGCSSDTETTGPGAKGVDGNGAVEAPPLPELEGDVTTKIATWEEIADAIADHKGKIVVVDLWSTWCEPCIEELPNLVNLKRKHQEALVTMTAAMDYAGLPNEGPEKSEPKITEILENVGAKFPNYISSTPDEEVFMTLDIVGLPAVLVYNASGELVKKFGNDGEFTYEKDVIPFVEKLLAESK